MWQRKTFLYGERLVDRMDFEELALKSVDTSLGPKLMQLKRSEDKVTSDSPSPLVSAVPSYHCFLADRLT